MTEKKYKEAIEKSDELGKKLLSNPENELRCELKRDYQKRKSFLQFVNTEKAWLKFLYQVHKPLVFKTASVAAALILAFFVFKNQEPVYEELAVQEIKPAEGSIALRLASGQVVTLDSTFAQGFAGARLDEAGESISYHEHGIQTETLIDSPAAKAEQEINYHELIIPKGRSFTLVLNDGTRVWLNSESSLRYPASFSREERVVFLEGEAYFDVARDESRAFRVETSDQQVTVLGTSFNISAYADEELVATTLVSGAVSVVSGNEEKMIYPGEQFRYHKTLKDATVENVDTDIYTSWIRNELLLDRTTLAEIVNRLQRRYDISFEFTEDSLKYMTYTGSIPLNANLSVILGQLSRVSAVDFQVQGEKVVVKNK